MSVRVNAVCPGWDVQAGAKDAAAAPFCRTLLALGIRTGEILRVSVDDGVVETLYADSPTQSPDGIVVDGHEIFWTTMGRPTRRPDIPGEAGLDYSAPTGGIHAITYGGTECRDITTQGAITTGKHLAYDGAGSLYFGDREGFRVSRIETNGSSLTDLVVNPRDDEGLGECIGVAVDTDRRHLYWTQKYVEHGTSVLSFRFAEAEFAGSSCSREARWGRWRSRLVKVKNAKQGGERVRFARWVRLTPAPALLVDQPPAIADEIIRIKHRHTTTSTLCG